MRAGCKQMHKQHLKEKGGQTTLERKGRPDARRASRRSLFSHARRRVNLSTAAFLFLFLFFVRASCFAQKGGGGSVLTRAPLFFALVDGGEGERGGARHRGRACRPSSSRHLALSTLARRPPRGFSRSPSLRVELERTPRGRKKAGGGAKWWRGSGKSAGRWAHVRVLGGAGGDRGKQLG